jgi:hypothetical protein
MKTNNSSDSSFHKDQQIILEECVLENIPNILSNIPQQVAQVTSLLLKGMKHHPVKSFPRLKVAKCSERQRVCKSTHYSHAFICDW